MVQKLNQLEAESKAREAGEASEETGTSDADK